jgi:hypothetical protein
MAVARIYRNQGLGSPVLQKERFGWVMEFASERPQHADPLTGWAGGAEPLAQVRIVFPTREAAVAYCEREGLPFAVQEDPPRKLLLQSYADNFR